MNATHGSTPAVEYGTLALGRRLGQGGQGTVHEVTNKRINKTAGGGWEVAYKEYSPTVLAELDVAVLSAQVDLPSALGATEGRWLCDSTAWPAAVVRRNGQVCGLLMRMVPDRFQFTLKGLTSTSPASRRLANLEYLLNTDAYITGIGLGISDSDRVLLLADLAVTLSRLHRIGIAVGDLSPKNLLFTIDPAPQCFLIDCDAMRLHGATALPQAETPDWQVPGGEEKATPASDVYKLGLLAIRLFARDQTTTDPSALAAISPELGDLARTSLDPDPARRPTSNAWVEQLTATSHAVSTTPAAATVARNGPRPSNASSAGSAPGTAPTPATPPGRINWSSLKETVGALAVGLLLIFVIVGVAQNDSDSAGNASARPTVSEETYTPPEPGYESSDGGAGTGGNDSSQDDSYETPTPEEPDPLDEAFADVSPGDCLNVHDDGYGEWSEDEPDTVPCDWTTAYVSVTDVTDDSDTCEDGADSSTWSHVNDDATTTALCLERRFQEGTCFLAKGAGGKPGGAGLMTVWDCDASKVPVEYDFIMQITAVGEGTEGNCGQDYAWEVHDGEGTICARVA